MPAHRGKVGDLVGRELQDPEVLESPERGQVAYGVLPEVHLLQTFEASQRRGVGDAIVVQVHELERAGAFEALQARDPRALRTYLQDLRERIGVDRRLVSDPELRAQRRGEGRIGYVNLAFAGQVLSGLLAPPAAAAGERKEETGKEETGKEESRGKRAHGWPPMQLSCPSKDPEPRRPP